jgi:SAM-dependent methyltransferase
MTEQPDASMRAYWDEAARTNAAWYVDTSLDYDSPDIEKFFETGRVIVTEALEGSPLWPPGLGRAVEIGSGLGRVCRALAERFEHVVGVDISPEMVARARELVPDDRIAFHVGDGASLAPVADGSADLVLTFTVFQHIPSTKIIEGYIREAGRVLGPGGVFVFQWNNIPGPRRWAARRKALEVLQRTGLRTERYRRHAPAFLGSRVPVARVRRALASGGLELAHTKGLGTLYAWAWAVKRG